MRTTIEIDDELIVRFMRRYARQQSAPAIDLALRRLHLHPTTRGEMLEMRQHRLGELAELREGNRFSTWPSSEVDTAH